MSRGCALPMGSSPLLFATLVLALCTAVAGHGFLAIPKARNYIAHLKGQEYCEHCLSAGGPGLVSTLTPGGSFPAKETIASAVRHSMCGEAVTIPPSQRKYNPAPVASISSLPVYAAGQEFDISIDVSVHHRGHFEFRLCDAAKLDDPKTVTWACLDEHVLQRVSVPGEVSPVDVNYPERYYLEPTCAPNYNTTVTMRYKMPAELTCERCVMQWWWITGNSCNPPGYANRSPQPAHVATGCKWWEDDLTNCGGWSYPEEFWNCADVRIVGATNPTPALANAEPPAQRPAVPVAAPAPAPVPAPAPAPQTPAAPVEQGCTNLGWQCGGSGWTGSTCCNQGSCLAYIPEYSECRVDCPAGWLCNQQTPPPAAAPAVPQAPPAVPKPAPKAPPAVPKAPPAAPKAPPAAPKAPPTAPPTAPAPAPAAAQTCAGNGWQCGGDGWTGSTCCVAGTQCYAYIPTYSQCRASCPIGWMCSADKQKDLLTSAIDWVKKSLA